MHVEQYKLKVLAPENFYQNIFKPLMQVNVKIHNILDFFQFS